jgi:hypothetical protein
MRMAADRLLPLTAVSDPVADRIRGTGLPGCTQIQSRGTQRYQKLI